eukprot:7092979-Prymnesium_polylepis.1
MSQADEVGRQRALSDALNAVRESEVLEREARLRFKMVVERAAKEAEEEDATQEEAPAEEDAAEED